MVAFSSATTEAVADPRVRMMARLGFSFLGIAALLALATQAQGAIDTSASALDLAEAIVEDPSFLVGASFVEKTATGTPAGTSTTAMAGFPSSGSDYAIMTTGNAALADDPDVSESSGQSNGGMNVRGDADYDVLILRIDLDVPAEGFLHLDYRFLSEEYSEWVGTAYNDAFVAELDVSTWTTEGTRTIAPYAFALESVSGSMMSSDESSGTTYDGATQFLTASIAISPGSHSVFLSVFDRGDTIYDTAVFVDNLRFDLTEPPSQGPPPPQADEGWQDDYTSCAFLLDYGVGLQCDIRMNEIPSPMCLYQAVRNMVPATLPSPPQGCSDG